MEGITPYPKEEAEKYTRLRWWLGVTFGDILDKAADVYPDKEALVDSTTRLTYSQLREKANRLAISLMALGIQPADRVLLQLPNWSEFVYSYFALQKIGAIVVIAISRFAQTELNHLCRITGARAWLVAEKYRSTDYLPIIADVRKAHPSLEHVILVRSSAQNRSFSRLEDLVARAELSEANIKKLAARRPEPTAVAHMGPTGGTTGVPKVAARTHNDYICRTEYAARGWQICCHDTGLAVIPIGHDACFGQMVCPILFNSGKLVMLDSTDPKDIAATIEKEKVTALVGVPPLYRRLVDFAGLDKYDLSSLKKVYAGGQASPQQLVQDVYNKLRCKYVNAYGGTEGMCTMTRLDDDPAAVHRTVGRPTCPYDVYKIIDENEKVLPPDTPGELCIHGPSVFSGYFNSPEENARAFTRDGFFKTGDQAVLDKQGNITITGRLKDIIKRGGENISPVEIEGLIIKHPGVEAVAVVGMPDKDLGERICAYIQPKTGAKLTFEEVISFLKKNGASVLQLPERIELIDAMPLVNVKIDKKVLREDIKKKLLEVVSKK